MSRHIRQRLKHRLSSAKGVLNLLPRGDILDMREDVFHGAVITADASHGDDGEYDLSVLA